MKEGSGSKEKSESDGNSRLEIETGGDELTSLTRHFRQEINHGRRDTQISESGNDGNDGC